MKKFEKKDLQYPVDYEWKTNFDYFWNTKSDQKEWVLPKVLKEQSEKNGAKDFLQFSYNNPLTYSEVNTFANQIANSCLLYTSPSPRDRTRSRMPSSA